VPVRRFGQFDRMPPASVKGTVRYSYNKNGFPSIEITLPLPWRLAPLIAGNGPRPGIKRGRSPHLNKRSSSPCLGHKGQDWRSWSAMWLHSTARKLSKCSPLRWGDTRTASRAWPRPRSGKRKPAVLRASAPERVQVLTQWHRCDRRVGPASPDHQVAADGIDGKRVEKSCVAPRARLWRPGKSAGSVNVIVA